MNYFKDFYSSKYRYASFKYQDFPYDVPEIYIVTHYMTALQNLMKATYKNQTYYTSDGEYWQLYNKNNFYIPTYKLQTKDACWAMWWQSNAQSLDFEVNGFDRDFFYQGKNAKFYNLDYNRDGKTSRYCTRGAFLPHENEHLYPTGSSYSCVPNDRYLKNYLCIYYLTSQAEDFEYNLMQIAKEVKINKSDNPIIFYPNAIYDIPNAYYQIPWSSTSIQTDVAGGNGGIYYDKNYRSYGSFNY